MKAYTGIFTTKDERLARRVITHLNPLPQTFFFIFKDGWYEIITPGILPSADAAALNRLAHCYAGTDLPAAPIQNFKQGDLN